jgi:formylglycine-generating enzyme required for sulfatase activity
MRSTQELRSTALAATFLTFLAAPLCAQRTTALVGPPALGTTCFVEHRMPVSPTSRIAGFLWSAPYAGAVLVPGLAVEGLLRVDPDSFLMLGIGVTNGAPPLSMPLAVPNQTALLGAQLECQSFDVDATSTFRLASNDVLVRVVSGPPVSFDMVAIPTGTFQMGSPVVPFGVAPYFNQGSAQPVHEVTISRPFWMGRHEVTQAQYQSVMGSNPSAFQGASHPNAPQRPVERVLWTDAVAYCQALAAGRLPAGYVYRLPTEAEWEYCCRAGTTTEYHYGASVLCGQANIGGTFHPGPVNVPCSASQTTVVGSYAPNAFGLFDMHGNVMEWCLDAWDAGSNYPAAPVTDPFVPNGNYKVLRGGSWYVGNNVCRSAARSYMASETVPYHFIGFRVVCAPAVP